MKRQILLSFMVVYGCYASAIGYSEEDFVYVDSHGYEQSYNKALIFVNAVQKRYYVIQRLEEAVDHLLSCYGSLCGQTGDDFKAIVCRECGLKKELLLVTTFWHDCLSYKRIMTDNHIREFLIHLIVLYDALLKVCGKGAGLVVAHEKDSLEKDSLEKDSLENFFRENFSQEIFSRINYSRVNFSRKGLDELLDTVDRLAATSKSIFDAKFSVSSPCGSKFFGSKFFGSKFFGSKFFGSKSYSSKPLSLTQQNVPSLSELRDLEGRGNAFLGEAVSAAITNELFFISSTAGEPTAEEPTAGEPDGELFQALSDTYRKDDFLVKTTVRFYLLRRVATSLERLSLLARNTTISAVCSQLPPVDAFQSAVMRECLHAMVVEGTLQPLFTLWESIGSYRYISDPYLIREILLIVVQVYKMAMKLLVPSQEQEAVQADQVIDVYNAISLLPFPELFELLDELTQQSLSIATVYQEGTVLGWKAALKQYWWLPPVMMAGCATLYLRIKHIFSQPHYRQSSLKAPVLSV